MKPLLGCTAVLKSTEIHGSCHQARPCLDLLLLQWNGVRIIRTKRVFSSFLSLPATMLRGLHFTQCFQLSAGLSLWAVQNSLSGGAHRSYRGKERDVSAWAQLEGWCAGQCRWGGRRALSLFFFTSLGLKQWSVVAWVLLTFAYQKEDSTWQGFCLSFCHWILAPWWVPGIPCM